MTEDKIVILNGVKNLDPSACGLRMTLFAGLRMNAAASDSSDYLPASGGPQNDRGKLNHRSLYSTNPCPN